MAKIVRKIDGHNLEVDYSAWTGMAKIRLDSEEILSKFSLGHTEVITIDEKRYCVNFSGIIFPNVEIHKCGETLNK